MDIYIKPCYSMATDLDMALSGSKGWDFTVATGGFVSYSYQAVPLHP